jgi:hypothetical protein
MNKSNYPIPETPVHGWLLIVDGDTHSYHSHDWEKVRFEAWESCTDWNGSATDVVVYALPGGRVHLPLEEWNEAAKKQRALYLAWESARMKRKDLQEKLLKAVCTASNPTHLRGLYIQAVAAEEAAKAADDAFDPAVFDFPYQLVKDITP